MNQDQIVEKQLETISTTFPLISIISKAATIAGGFPRDMFFGNPGKDVDIFATAESDAKDWVEGKMAKLSKLLNVAARNKGSSSYTKSSEDSKDNGILSVWNFTKDGLSFDIVWLKKSITPDVHIAKEFDCGICKIQMDDTGCFVPSEEFNNALANEVLDFSSRESATSEHGVRLRRKFPDWKITIAGEEVDASELKEYTVAFTASSAMF